MKTHLNLLPFATQRSRQRSRWLRNALLLWGTTLICCVSYGHFQHAQLAEARAETAELELRCLPIRVATERSQVMQRELQRIASQLGEWDA
ncbi:MAG: hypothetical protein R3B90_20750 [Planctomycetaceae bacterium]